MGRYGPPSLDDFQILVLMRPMTAKHTVKACSTTDGCIAFGAYPNVTSDETVRVLTLGGKDPMDKDYPCIGKLGFVFKEANKVGAVKDFLDFALSKEVADEIRKAGALPAAE